MSPWEDEQGALERGQIGALADAEDARWQRPAAPRILSIDEGMGVYDPSPMNRRIAELQSGPQLSRGQRGMQHAMNIARGLAHGAAAGTGLPAWRRAQASIDQDFETQQRADAVEQKSRLAEIARIQEAQAAQMAERSKYASSPMSEYNGQRMPASLAMRLAAQEAQATVQGRQQSRLATAAKISAENTVSDNARADADAQWRREHGESEASRLQGNADRTFAAQDRHARASEAIQQGHLDARLHPSATAVKPPAPLSQSGIAQILKIAAEQLMSEAAHAPDAALKGVVPPTEAQINERAKRIIAATRELSGSGAAAPDPFDGIGEEDDEAGFMDPLDEGEDPSFNFNLGQ